jgi:hypothetical protein
MLPVQTSFLCKILFRSIPNLGYSEITVNSGKGALFSRGIAKTIPGLFHGIFLERNFDSNPSCAVLDGENLILFFISAA